MNSIGTRLREWVRLSIRTLVFCSTALGAAVTGAAPGFADGRQAIVVRSDRGGPLGPRSREIESLRQDGWRVELRGTCLSACTMYLGLPDVCVSRGALLGFHGPSAGGRALAAQEFERWSQVMARSYREPLRSWYLETARYKISGYLEIGGVQLIRMGYPEC